MDSIDSLDLDDNGKLTATELDVMRRYFDDKTVQVAGAVKEYNVQHALYLTILFILLSNPLTDGLLEYLPGCAVGYVKYAVKVLIFMLFAYIILISA